MFKMILKTDDSFTPIFLRLSLGVVIFAHGAQKVLGLFGGAGFEKTIEIFRAQMGFPIWMTVLLMVIEFFGSLGLLFGFLTRLCALGIGTSIAVCAYMNHIKNGFFMNWFGTQKGEGFEYHILVLGIALTLIIKGSGLLSFDRALMKGK
jgi:putative oxidoreductase